ncbi:MAG TPA: cyclodeaminase/cyclohydrolase family protein [Candidatus Limnocylindrales bacterium]|nr:cyclodeaminase/cyclohydrolase family protein [Candidatus Limnocylindrales bacterium]
MDERLPELTVRNLVERLASSDPVPGGGSASALAGAMGAALVHMVVELTDGRAAAAGHEETLTDIRTAAMAWQSELLDLAEMDASAYTAVVRARRMPRGSELERNARDRQLGTAIHEATRVPLATARAASEVLELARRLAPIGNRNAVSDVGVAALLATAALRGAALNVEINLPYVTADDELRTEAATEIARLLATLDERDRMVRDAVAERLR